MIETDKRLVSLLNAGETFLRFVDPDGLLSGAKVSRLVHSSASLDGARKWLLELAFRDHDGVRMTLSGIFKGTSVRLAGLSLLAPRPDQTGSQWKEFVVKPGKSLSEALGQVNGIPSLLKKYLSNAPDSQPSAENLPKKILSFFVNEEDALFWDVEGGLVKDGHRQAFTEYRLSFQRSRDDTLSKVFISAVASLEEGSVVLKGDADIFGLGGKEVILYRNLGMGREIRALCTVRREGKVIPSLKAAFDLDDVVPVFYCKNRKKKISIGKPQGVSKK